MKLVAALCWYDEPPETIDRCVRSLAGAVDTLVALDGRWELHADDAPALSPTGQKLALELAAGDAMLPAFLWSRPQVWPDQVTKRACLMELASEHGDWVLVIDADEYVAHVDGEALRAALTATRQHVASVLHTNIRVGTHATPWRRRIRRLYPAGTTVVQAHNGYRYGRRWLHGDPARVAIVPAADLSEHLQLEHDRCVRPPERTSSRHTYRELRQAHHVEAW